MKLVFPTTFDYPTRFAHPIHGLHMARAFAKLLGKDFLFTHGQITDASLLRGISSQCMLGPRPRRVKKMHLRSIVSFFWLATFLLKNKEEPPVFYVIDRAVTFLLVLLRPFFRFRFIFEYHALYHNLLDRLIVRYADGIIFLTHELQKRAYRDLRQTPPAIILPEGVDLEPYDRLSRISTDELRKKLNLPQDKLLIGYIGRFRPLDMDKGISALITAATEMPFSIHIYCVGGAKGELAFYQNMAKEKGVADRITLLSFVDPSLVPEYARAFDILTYIPPVNDFFSYYTSPMKLFEYMAAQKPIIVSDLPAFREILSEEEAWFIRAGDAREFTRAVLRVLGERQEIIRQKTSRAYEKVAQYAWDKRAARVIELCKNL